MRDPVRCEATANPLGALQCVATEPPPGARRERPELAYPSVLDQEPRVIVNGRPWERGDFVLGPGHEVLTVQILAPWPGSLIETRVHPVGPHSGRIPAHTFLGPRFDLMPDLDGARDLSPSRQSNPPIAYDLWISLSPPLGEAKQYQVRLAQDEISILRQEYLDFRLSLSGHALPPARAEFGRIQVPPGLPFSAESFSRSSNYSVVLKGGMLELARELHSQLPDFLISSAFRNPKRNASTDGQKLSYHVRGRALDVTPTKPGAGPMLHLHRAAWAMSRTRVLVERGGSRQAPLPGPRQLMPSRTAPPRGELEDLGDFVLADLQLQERRVDEQGRQRFRVHERRTVLIAEATQLVVRGPEGPGARLTILEVEYGKGNAGDLITVGPEPEVRPGRVGLRTPYSSLYGFTTHLHLQR